MAKVIIARMQALKDKIIKYKEERAKLRSIVRDSTTSKQEKFQAIQQLAAMSSKTFMVKWRKVCPITGKARGLKINGINGHLAYLSLEKGLIPGMIRK